MFIFPCIINLYFRQPTRCSSKQSLFTDILLPSHSTYFGCLPHPSSGIHKTVVTTTGTRHEIGDKMIKSVKSSPWSSSTGTRHEIGDKMIKSVKSSPWSSSTGTRHEIGDKMIKSVKRSPWTSSYSGVSHGYHRMESLYKKQSAI
jgi:hypothetical protein